MVLKILSLVFTISLAFGFTAPNQVKTVSFDAGGVIQRVNQNYSDNPKIPHSEFRIPNLQGEFLIDTSTAPRNQYNPAIAFDGTNYFVVWEDDRNDSGDIYGARVDQNGNILDPGGIPISTAPERQLHPKIAFDGTNYLVVWDDFREGRECYGARVNQQGVVIDTAGIKISSGGLIAYPNVAFGDTYYLVIWTYAAGVRVNQQGLIIDTAYIIIDHAGVGGTPPPSICFGATNYFVVWRSGGYVGRWYYFLIGGIVTQQGIVLNGNIRIQWFTNFPIAYPSVTFDGTNYFVFWTDARNGERNCDIYGARISPIGIVLDPTGIPISTAVNSQGLPSVASNGTSCFVVWQDYRRNPNSSDIYGAIVNQSGVVIASFPVSTQPGNQIAPALAHGSGDEFLIVYSGWTDSINHQSVNNYRIWGKFSSSIGIEKENQKLKRQSGELFEIYPNPAKSFLTIRLPLSADRSKLNAQGYGLKIFDVSGKVIREIEMPSTCKDSEVKISLKGINPGIYFLKFGNQTKKFLVVR
ncbi:MAG: T9SS type A sorting domain-containing protein [candidate division WOR-3 bacterium]